MSVDRLFTLNYIQVCLATFLTSFSFYLLLPTLPFYLVEVFKVDQGIIGAVLSCYVIAVLSVRPFAGFFADAYPRKMVYIIAFISFALSAVGYLFITSSLLAFIILRVVHGFAFGALTTTANTLVIDVMPSSRRGEGLGYYGVMNNLAMAFGPMTGLFIVSSGNYMLLFAIALVASLFGLLLAVVVKVPVRPPVNGEKRSSLVSADRFILLAGLPAGVSMMLLAVPYGITTSYIAVYATQLGITEYSGFFFTIMAVGLIISRLHSGKRVDRGCITSTINMGMAIALLGVCGEVFLSSAASVNVMFGYAVYFLSAFLIGYGFGTMFPAFNTLFINLAPNSRRATANATYLTGWDVGIGFGMFFGGALAAYGFVYSFVTGAVTLALSSIFFIYYVAPHFTKNRLR